MTSVRAQTWPNMRDAVIIAIESVHLWGELSGLSGKDRIFVMFSFLPTLCKAQQQQTQSLPASQERIVFDFCLVPPIPTVLGHATHQSFLLPDLSVTFMTMRWAI